MYYSVWFHNTLIGGVFVEPAHQDGALTGRLRPADAYWQHRPDLQRLTLGMAALRDEPPERLESAFEAAVGGIERLPRTPRYAGRSRSDDMVDGC